ncbi:MAG: lipid A biosynthesis lauroyl acyltransferase, partial [Hyphomicrobiales bacterium]|nr:lipid A biosynthesis lauroyl acyltransferase [Hyphomicrobiales bacterium]
ARSIRLPEGRFRLELMGPLELERDESGKIAIEPAMQTVANLIEGWVREYPEQWLWLHRRWRG